MDLKIRIHNIKCIENLEVSLPTAKGLYAITGINGSGKSTIAACAASLFYDIPKYYYFGNASNDSYVEYEYNSVKQIWGKTERGWLWREKHRFAISGFFEGSLLYGNRFRNMSFENIKKLTSIPPKESIVASNFVTHTMGYILQDDENHYAELQCHKIVTYDYYKRQHVSHKVFSYKSTNHEVNQFHMSTGENLLVSILSKIEERNSKRKDLSIPCLLFLDEIELALHPKAIVRLVNVLKKIAEEYNYAIFFTTQAVSIINEIPGNNILYIDHKIKDGHHIHKINYCYPAKAIAGIYKPTQYDKVICVEDDMGRAFVNELLLDLNLRLNRHILVLPCGGCINAIDFAKDAMIYEVLCKKENISVILDKDVEGVTRNHIAKLGLIRTLPFAYIPIMSFEKYLKENLYRQPDNELINYLDDVLMQPKNIAQIVEEFKKSPDSRVDTKGREIDSDGKKFYMCFQKALDELGHERATLIRVIVLFLRKIKPIETKELEDFLLQQMS